MHATGKLLNKRGKLGKKESISSKNDNGVINGN